MRNRICGVAFVLINALAAVAAAPAAAQLDAAQMAAAKQIKPGDLQLPLRIMLVGEKSGPPVFDIAALLGSGETENRILNLLNQTGNW